MFLYILLWMIGVQIGMHDLYFVIDAVCIGLSTIKMLCGAAKAILNLLSK